MAIFSFIIFSLIIIISSGIVSGTEAALLSLNIAKVKELEKSKNKNTQQKAQKLLKIKENLQEYISGIVILNNLINIIGSIYIGVLATNLFGELYLGLVSGILTFLIIIFSEIIPKLYGERFAKEVSLTIATPLIVITTILYPAIFLVNKLTRSLVKENDENTISEGEIKEMAAIGKQEGAINKYESEVINKVFRMNDIEVHDIMVPHNQIKFIRHNAKYSEIARIAERTGFTRFPITKHGEVIGQINVKDLFKYYNRQDNFEVSKIIRPIFYVPESMKISTLESKMKQERTHIAAVVNEYGDLIGLVTLEDVIEELLGEIEDEFDEKKEYFKKISDNTYQIDATADIYVLNEEFNLNLNIDDDTDFTTINGFLTDRLNKIPKTNNVYKTSRAKFRVIKANKRQALDVEMTLLNKE